MKNKLLSCHWSEWCTSLYLICMFLGFPLYYRNNYIDILESKTSFFVIVTVIYLCVVPVALWLESVFGAEKNKKKNGKATKQIKRKKTGTAYTVFFLMFILAVILSTLLSGDIGNAWNSFNGKMFGTKIILLCCGIYFWISRTFYENKTIIVSFTIGTGIVMLLSVLNRYGIDPLGMYSNLVVNQKDIYISTIGNVNIVSNYICLFLPVIIGMFLYGRSCRYRIIYGILVYIGIMAGISTNSDSFFLGIVVCMLFYLWHSMENKESLVRYLYLCVISIGSIISLDNSCAWEKLQKYIIEDVPWIYILVCFLVFIVVLKNTKRQLELNKLRNILFLLIGIIFLIIVMGVIKNFVNGAVLSDSWGTNRGFVWKRTWILFKELPWYKKIIGIGPGAFKDFLGEYNREIRPFTDPHSEILYYLVSTGIVGLIGYLGMIISIIRKCSPVFAAAFLAWLAQGTVNTSLVFTTPYLFIFMGICQYKMRK